MIRRVNGRSLWLMACAAFALAVAMPAAAQSTGMVRGVVLDAQGQPVDGAKINIDMTGGTNRHFDTPRPPKRASSWAPAVRRKKSRPRPPS
ncbi:MAG: hypothetical protein AUI11_01350 [Acidobacteria bacterium 13_2_20CM_2_66_4]|nr:MAG: hypothetical protein AUI11_01350 [Acidobacteria bacterium 13_2_20CM_2_66_4]